MAALIDTNVLVYRFDPRFPNKQRIAADLLRHGIEHDAVDALAIGSFLDQDLLQLRTDHPIDIDLGTGDLLAAIFAVCSEPVQGLDHWAMGAVVGPEHEGSQDQRQHAPVVMAV